MGAPNQLSRRERLAQYLQGVGADCLTVVHTPDCFAAAGVVDGWVRSYSSDDPQRCLADKSLFLEGEFTRPFRESSSRYALSILSLAVADYVDGRIGAGGHTLELQPSAVSSKWQEHPVRLFPVATGFVVRQTEDMGYCNPNCIEESLADLTDPLRRIEERLAVLTAVCAGYSAVTNHFKIRPAR